MCINGISEPQADEAANRPRPDLRDSRPPATILLVEDDNPVREATTLFLETRGYRVLAAGTDDQALWLWERHAREVDLLITDLMIPTHSSGVELARRFTSDKPGLPVILTSGFGRDIGEDDPDFPTQLPFIQKPFDPRELETLLTALLQRPG